MANSRIVFGSGSITITPLAATLTFTTAPPKVISINVQDPVSVGDSFDAKIRRASWWRRVPKLVWAALSTLLTVWSNVDRIARLAERAPEWYEKAKQLLRDLW